MRKQFPNEAKAYIYVVQRWSLPRLESSDEECKEHPYVKDPETEELRKELSTHDFVQPGVHYRDVKFKQPEPRAPVTKEFKIREWILDKAQMWMLIFVVLGCELVLFYLFVLFIELCDRLFS